MDAQQRQATPSRLRDADLEKLYSWVDEIPLSRPKRNIARDFSDGVLVAEIVAFYFPKLVEMHNYGPANSAAQKVYNWNALNDRVMKRLGHHLSKAEIDAVVLCEPGAVERLLYALQFKMARHRAKLRDSAAAAAANSSFNSRQQQQQQQQRYSGDTAEDAAAGAGDSADGWERRSVEQERSQRQGERAAAGAGGVAAAAPAHRSKSSADGSFGGFTGANGVGRAPRGGPDAAAAAVLAERDATIRELHETVDVLQLKVAKLEQLVRLKDAKIYKLQERLTPSAEQQEQPPQQQQPGQQQQYQQQQRRGRDRASGS